MALRRRRAAWIAACALSIALPTSSALGDGTHISTLAGADTAILGDGGPATAAGLSQPAGVAALAGGGSSWDVFIADQGNCRVRKVLGTTGVISTVAGNGSCTGAQSFAAANATSSALGAVPSITATSAGSLLVVDRKSAIPMESRVQRWDPAGTLTTVAGNAAVSCPSVASTTPATATSVPLCLLQAVVAHPSDSDRFLVLDANEVMEVDNGQLRRVAGGGCTTPGPGAFGHCFLFSRSAMYTSTNEFIVADFTTRTVTKFSTADSAVATQIAGGGATYPGDGGQAAAAQLRAPVGLTKSYDGGYYIAESDPANEICRIRKVAGFLSTSIISTAAGSGSCLSAERSDGVPATSSSLVMPSGTAIYPGGLLISEPFGKYVSGGVGSTVTGRIRLVDRTTLLTRPPALTNAAQLSLTMASLEPDAALVCEINNTEATAFYDPCANPKPIVPLPDGINSFTFNVLGPPQDPTPPLAVWTIDRTPPSPFALTAPAGGSTGVEPLPTFSWQPASDPNGIDHYELWIDGQKNRDVGTSTTTQPAGPLSEAQHSWQVKVFDVAGNSRISDPVTFSSGSAPTAALTASPNPALAGRSVSFDASASSDASGPIARYEWDLDGDGSFETDTGAVAGTSRSYDSARTINVAVRVTDGVTLTATAATELRITTATAPTAGQLGVTINNGAQYTRSPDVTVSAVFPPSITSMLFSNDGGFLVPQTFTPQAATKWKLDSSGPERLPKIVYVRFLTGPFASETHTDDIILDETPPTVGAVTLRAPTAGSSSARASARAKRWTVRLTANDSNSGVAGVYVTSNKRKRGRLLRYRKRMTVRSAKPPRFVRARDRAGNLSRWRTAKRR